MKKHKKFKITETREEFLKHIKDRLPKNPICAEVGVLRGEFSLKIWKLLQPKKLVLVDPWEEGIDKNSPFETYQGKMKDRNHKTVYSSNKDYENVRNMFQGQIAKGTIELCRQYSYDYAEACIDEYFDLIYIDATHIYESALADLRSYFPKIKKGGIICGHDYLVCDHFTVKKAVDQFADENELEFLSLGSGKSSDFSLIKKEIK
jgi:hypothetical protein